MGDFSSPRHEWIELYNTTNPSKIKTGSSDVNDPNRYSGIGLFLISNNRAKDCNLAVIPDLVEASVTLTNTQLQVKLYDVAGRLIDTADDGIGKPMAGDSAQKKAMVRRRTTGHRRWSVTISLADRRTAKPTNKDLQ